MLLPISDAPNPKGVPWATWTLIAVNVALYLVITLPLGLQPVDTQDPAFSEYLEFLSRFVSSRAELAQAVQGMSAYDLFVFEHGYRPAQPSLADLFFSLFLHGGLMHLAGNMLFLWIYGDNVERRLGVPAFLLWYLLTGVAATLFHAALFSDSQVPLVGASGAISGVLGFYFIWFPRNVVRVMFFLPPFFFDVFEISARIVLAVYLFFDNVLPFLLTRGGGVAHGAHIGGFIAGAAVAWLMDRRRLAARPHDLPPPSPERPGAGALQAALQRGDWEGAAERFFELPPATAAGALSLAEAVALADRLHLGGRSEAALVLLGRVIRGAARSGPSLAEAYALAGTILLEARGDVAAAYQYLQNALRLDPGPETTAAVRRGLARIDELQKRRVGNLRRPPW